MSGFAVYDDSVSSGGAGGTGGSGGDGGVRVGADSDLFFDAMEDEPCCRCGMWGGNADSMPCDDVHTLLGAEMLTTCGVCGVMRQEDAPEALAGTAAGSEDEEEEEEEEEEEGGENEDPGGNMSDDGFGEGGGGGGGGSGGKRDKYGQIRARIGELYEMRNADKRETPKSRHKAALTVATVISELLAKRPLLEAEIVNLVIHQRSAPVRAKLRLLHTMQQEQYLAARDVVRFLETKCFNALHSLDIRANKTLSISILNAIRAFSTVDGKRILLPHGMPPAFGKGQVNTRKSNTEQGIGRSPLLAPFAVKSSVEIREQMDVTLGGRELHLATDHDGAAWDVCVTGTEVFQQALKEGNLLPRPPNILRRLQLLFDGHGWTKAIGAARFLLRTPELRRDFNATRFARDYNFILGADKLAYLELAIRTGGEKSLFARAMAGCKVEEVPVASLPDNVRNSEVPPCSEETGSLHAFQRLAAIRCALAP